MADYIRRVWEITFTVENRALVVNVGRTVYLLVPLKFADMLKRNGVKLDKKTLVDLQADVTEDGEFKLTYIFHREGGNVG